MHRHCILVNVDAHPDAIWRVLSRLSEITNYMPSLLSSELLHGNAPGVGAVRHCVDTAGRSWSEECVEFDLEQRRFVVRFLTAEPGFPLPARHMVGGWEVTPAGDGAVVMVWWELEPKPRWLAPILLPLLAFKADRDFPKIARRWPMMLQPPIQRHAERQPDLQGERHDCWPYHADDFCGLLRQCGNEW
jgi:hypothetical protein